MRPTLAGRDTESRYRSPPLKRWQYGSLTSIRIRPIFNKSSESLGGGVAGGLCGRQFPGRSSRWANQPFFADGGGYMCCVSARALFHTAPRRVEVRELPTPRPAVGEGLVRTLCSGISGG